MKITKQQLRRVIQEELTQVLREQEPTRSPAETPGRTYRDPEGGYQTQLYADPRSGESGKPGYYRKKGREQAQALRGDIGTRAGVTHGTSIPAGAAPAKKAAVSARRAGRQARRTQSPARAHARIRRRCA